jgi:hypothetical protein
VAEIVREVVVGSAVSASALDHVPKGGRPYKYPMATIEAALWEAAAAGGSAHKAHLALKERGFGDEPEGVPPARTIRDWIKGSFRNRYAEILEGGVRELEEAMAQQATAFALRAGEAQIEALRQTTAGLAAANGVEASQILRNVAQARKMGVDESGELRRRPFRREADESLLQIAKELEGFGILKISEGIADQQVRRLAEEEQIVDAVAVDDPPAAEASDAAST